MLNITLFRLFKLPKESNAGHASASALTISQSLGLEEDAGPNGELTEEQSRLVAAVSWRAW
jgi:hypothetical protein